jgi:RNA polymerase sigma-70 factor (ECF subfamily)
MTDAESFAEFLRRVRAGDQEAAAELVRTYEGALRVEVRLRLTDPALCRVLDSDDICQSVMASFFVRAAAGQFDLEGPRQLLQLLLTMARNKVAYHARKAHTRRRGRGRVAEPRSGQLEAVPGGAEPSRLAAARDLLDEVRRRLTPEERQLADLRGGGRGWAEVATAVGSSPDACRKQLTRALDRVAAEIGLDESPFPRGAS